MKRILFFSYFLLIFSSSFAHKYAKYNVVIDSDCGIDDFRAITYFLASKDFNVNAITTVDGVLTPIEGAEKIYQILSLYHHEGVLIGKGENRNASKKYSSHAKKYWKNFLQRKETKEYKSAEELLFNAINNNYNPTIIVAMGPLSNIYRLLIKQAEIGKKISYILWYSDFEYNVPKGYNYEEDIEAYNFIQKTAIPLKILSTNDYVVPASFFLEDCKELKTKYSQNISKFFSNSEKEKKYFLWDDFLPLFIIYPQLFQKRDISNTISLINIKKDTPYENLILTILNSEKRDAGVIFNEIPSSSFYMIKDISAIVDTLISLYGYDEYKLVSLSSEIHSHLGTYSILGAKMGLRIMEFLHVGLNEIKIESYAGSTPPISCLNDGLQIASGATMGYGAFSLNNNAPIFPEAVVYYNKRKIRIKLKEDIFRTIQSDISKLIKQYGLNTDMYWSELRTQSIGYWKNYSRFNIFDIIEEK